MLLTREPGGAPGAEAVRRVLLEGPALDPVTEALLHNAARREHAVRTLRPALAAGTWVVCDRFADSTLAYQGHAGGVDRAVLRALAAVALEGLTPDLTLVLDLDVAAGAARLAARGGAPDSYERRGADFHARVRAGFLAVAAAEPGRCAVVDAGRPPDTVAADLTALVAAWLGVAA